MSKNPNKTPLSCAVVERLASRFIDNDLPPTAFKRIQRHLDNCVVCRTLIGDIRKVVEVAKLLDDTPIPEGVRKRLRVALQKRAGYSAPERPRLYVVR